MKARMDYRATGGGPHSSPGGHTAPPQVLQRIRPRFSWRVFSCALLAGVLIGCFFGTLMASAVVVTGTSLVKRESADRLSAPAEVFTRDDEVVSVVPVSGAIAGDMLSWTFTGPDGSQWNNTKPLEPGESQGMFGVAMSTLSLRSAVGHWSVEVFYNKVRIDRRTFEVRPLTGLSFKAPFLGTGLVLMGALGLGVLILLITLIVRKKKG